MYRKKRTKLLATNKNWHELFQTVFSLTTIWKMLNWLVCCHFRVSATARTD